MNEQIIALFRKYINRQCSPDELEQVLAIVEKGEHQAEWDAVLSQDALDVINSEAGLSMREDEISSLHERILFDINIEQDNTVLRPKTIRLWPRIAAAAAIIIAVGAGLFYYNNHKVDEQITQLAKNDIAPGGNKAFLTLANGKRISLTDAANGAIAKQAGVSITKTANGQLIYSISNSIHNNSEELQYNTVETPKGGQYQVTLPDGTNVWLNAASSLKYPASFTSLKERNVQLTGEGYFEVAKDKAHPFIVETNKQEVEVLGTHFNINAYTDEPSTKTTLLEGSVRLNSSTNLKPGEQATLVSSGQISVAEVNTSKVVAWKNGKFIFDEENIDVIMRKLARWYNVEIVYQDDVQDRNFTASISRFDNISKILDKLSYTNKVHFKIEGRRIVVMR